MKKLLIIAIALVSIQGIAQEEKKPPMAKDKMQRMQDLTPEEAATLQTKRMTLHLDLSKSQQDEIYKINLDNATKRKEMMTAWKAKKESGDMEKPSKEERLQRENARLDHQIAVKAKMKKILNDDQYAKWEKSQARMGMKGNEKKQELRKTMRKKNMQKE
ncbi:hypothetical protein WJN01_14360 [Flavobacteriaceae bacterium SZ-1-7]|uniref:hypothetical protein n=1 Tax=Tamlana sedimenti TaxID=3134126 RepID=UPI0031253FAC